MNKYIYVLFENDYGGTFSSGPVTIGEAVETQEQADNFLNEDLEHRSYDKIRIVNKYHRKVKKPVVVKQEIEPLY